MRNPAFCICKNKGADQLHVYRTAKQRLCFRYIDSTNPLAIFCCCAANLCRTKSEISKTGFLATRLIFEGHLCIGVFMETLQDLKFST